MVQRWWQRQQRQSSAAFLRADWLERVVKTRQFDTSFTSTLSLSDFSYLHTTYAHELQAMMVLNCRSQSCDKMNCDTRLSHDLEKIPIFTAKSQYTKPLTYSPWQFTRHSVCVMTMFLTVNACWLADSWFAGN
jgi:hypothetical protein